MFCPGFPCQNEWNITRNVASRAEGLRVKDPSLVCTARPLQIIVIIFNKILELMTVKCVSWFVNEIIFN